jgi:hypothetical protein
MTCILAESEIVHIKYMNNLSKFSTLIGHILLIHYYSRSLIRDPKISLLSGCVVMIGRSWEEIHTAGRKHKTEYDYDNRKLVK